MLISAVILAKNSSQTILKCLESVGWCDEILVIDDNSTDNTVEVAQKAGAKVFTSSLDNDFSKQRNYAQEKAKGEWILFVDSDEIVARALREEIKSKIKPIDTVQRNNINGYFIHRVDFMWGKKLTHGEYSDIWLLRLAKNGKGKWMGKVHETWKVNGKIEKLQSILQHYPHQTISEFLQEINFYTTLRAEELFDNKEMVIWSDIIFYPKAKFILNFFLKMGFLDGIEGFIAALIMSFHSFLVRAKLWQLSQKEFLR